MEECINKRFEFCCCCLFVFGLGFLLLFCFGVFKKYYYCLWDGGDGLGKVGGFSFLQREYLYVKTVLRNGQIIWYKMVKILARKCSQVKTYFLNIVICRFSLRSF